MGLYRMPRNSSNPKKAIARMAHSGGMRLDAIWCACCVLLALLTTKSVSALNWRQMRRHSGGASITAASGTPAHAESASGLLAPLVLPAGLAASPSTRCSSSAASTGAAASSTPASSRRTASCARQSAEAARASPVILGMLSRAPQTRGMPLASKLKLVLNFSFSRFTAREAASRALCSTSCLSFWARASTMPGISPSRGA
mmetsp:Transcript_40664/g.105116  ORF Transcript_40664/g.105116 Transcript_40664/m.105116 type:complete len:201 (-) Transcript_40664:1669-2271(-)